MSVQTGDEFESLVAMLPLANMIFRLCAFSYDWRGLLFVHYDTHTDRMQMVSLRIDRNCMASHLHAISCGETIRSEIILLTRGMHTPSPLPDADRWSLQSLYTNPGSALDIIVMQIFPCYSLFSFHPDVTCLIYSIILPASRHSTGETIRSERRNKRKSSWWSDLVGKQDLRRLQRIQPSARLPGSGTIRWTERRRN